MECHDCQSKVEQAKAVPYKTPDGVLHKCLTCYQITPGLRLKQDCEVYSRTVGYIRPVSQMNPGKKAEVKKRKNLKF